ncbi:MAG: hypothetical protein KAJ51_10125, partial [Thermoplasmata archaeon]|nr:hypothetical protein [Thermoplasmata archaeon]
MLKYLNAYEKKSLILLVLGSYLMLAIPLGIISFGVEGEIHSYEGNYNNLVEDGDSEGYGRFRGDAYFDDNTGWVVCSGKIRFFGDLKIENADFHYYAEDVYESGAFIGTDYQRIKLSGTDGEMEGGISVFIFSLIGSAIGFLIWFGWYSSKKSKRHSILISYSALMITFTTTTILIWFHICFGVFLIFIPIYIVILLSASKYRRNLSSFFPEVCVGFGVLFFFIAALNFIFPVYESYGTYDSNTAIMCV